VEIDPVLAAALPPTVADRLPEAADRLQVITADAMTIDDLPGPAPTAVVANLPYNVAVPVLLHVLATWPTIATGLVMVQAEVADRIAAAPGSRVYGVPSAKTAWWANATRAGSIARTVFWPMPNVDSALVKLVRREPPTTTATRQEVFAVVDAAFAQRRKTLRGALASLTGSPVRAEAALRAADIDPSTRGESLDIGGFSRLAVEMRAVRSSS
jgi:16S rRNA (adenine1518-N6/adenine1519-N6)-dimethyltransferase